MDIVYFGRIVDAVGFMGGVGEMLFYSGSIIGRAMSPGTSTAS